jgi:hypothetical protein
METNIITVTNVVTLMATNAQPSIGGLDVVNAVNTFYSGAFTSISWLLGILVTFFSLVLGAIYYLIQNLQMKLQKEKLEKKFVADFESLEKKLRENILTSLSDEKAGLEKKFKELEARIEISTLQSKASTFALMGKIASDSKEYTSAFNAFVKSIDASANANKAEAAQRSLRLLTKKILPLMNKGHFSGSEHIKIVDMLLKSCEAINSNSLLSMDISDFKKELDEAKKREAK